jgi:hypothetical protein
MRQPTASPQAPDRAALLVVRAWREAGSATGFRARVTQVPDASGTAETVAVVESAEALHEAVRALVEHVSRPADPSGDGRTPAR